MRGPIVVIHFHQNGTAAIPGKEKLAAFQRIQAVGHLVERVLLVIRVVHLGTQDVIHLLGSFMGKHHQVDVIKMRPIHFYIRVAHLDFTNIGIRDAHLLLGVIVSGDDAIMPHPPLMLVHVTPFNHHGETGSHQTLYQVNVAAITHDSIQVSLRLDVVEHFVGHHVAVFFAGFKHLFGHVLVTFPTPIGKNHGHVGRAAVIKPLSFQLDALQLHGHGDARRRDGWRGRNGGRRRVHLGGLGCRRGRLGWRPRGQRRLGSRNHRALFNRAKSDRRRWVEEVKQPRPGPRQVVIGPVLNRWHLVQAHEDERQQRQTNNYFYRKVLSGLFDQLPFEFNFFFCHTQGIISAAKNLVFRCIFLCFSKYFEFDPY